MVLSVLLPWGFHCSHATPGCPVTPVLATLPQVKETSHLCSLVPQDEQHLILATYQPSGQVRQPGACSLACSHHHFSAALCLHTPGNTLSTFLTFPALALLQLPPELLFTSDSSMGRSSGTALWPTWEGCPRQGKGAVGHPSS